MVLKSPTPARAPLCGHVGVRKPMYGGRDEAFGVFDAFAGAAREQEIGCVFGLLDVWPEEYGSPCRRGLEQVVSSTRHERPPHKGDRRPCKHSRQIAQSIEQEHTPRSELRAIGLRAPHQLTTAFAHDAFDLIGTFRIARCQHERDPEPSAFGRLKSAQRRFLLARVGAASDEKRTVGESRFKLGRQAGRDLRRTQLQIAADPDAVLWHTQGYKAPCILLGSCPDRRKAREGSPEQRCQAAVARERAIRDAA